MKKICTLISALVLMLYVNAVPALQEPITVMQPDGTQITIQRHGDEFFHYTTNESGQWVSLNSNGMYEVVQPLSEQQITERREKSELRKISPYHKSQMEWSRNIVPNGLVILVNFKDLKFSPQNSLNSMREMYMGRNYSYNGATGSVQKYFIDQSMGQYMPEFEVVGPVTLSNNYAYYGANNSNSGDARPRQMIREACRLAHDECGVDFSKYDFDNDNCVDFVFIVYAGYNEAEGGAENTIWPHKWYADGDATLYLDGKLISLYACTSEFRSNTGGERAGIGTFCHEFSHVLGLPDMYNTGDAKDSHKTLGHYEIMDSGNYNNNGNTPAGYSAYERWFMGWMIPQYINRPASLSLDDIKKSNSAYIITEFKMPNLNACDPDPASFYLVENRQQSGWDAYLPGHGMMLTKIHYNYYKWYYNNLNNNKSDMGIDIIEACDMNKNTITLSVGQPNDWGEQMYVWIWDDTTTNLIPNTQWPGAEMHKDADGQWQYSVIADKINVIFSDGYHQTDDILNVTQSSCVSLHQRSVKYYTASLSDCSEYYSAYGTSLDLFPAGANQYTKIPNRQITNIEEKNGVITFDFMGGNGAKELAFNYAQAVYLSLYQDITDKDVWELDLIHYDNNDEYDAYMAFAFKGNNETSITGEYDISDMYYAEYTIIDGTDTSTIVLTRGSLVLNRLPDQDNDNAVYRIIVDAYDTDGKPYYIIYDMEVDCWNRDDFSNIVMTDIVYGENSHICLSNPLERVVFFTKSTDFSDDIRCYIWHNDGFGNVAEVCGAWPGMRATPTDNEGTYRFNIPDDGYPFNSSWMIVFNDGTNQTEDLVFHNQYLYSQMFTNNKVVTRPITESCDGGETNLEISLSDGNQPIMIFSSTGQLICIVPYSQCQDVIKVLPQGLYLVGKDKVLKL